MLVFLALVALTASQVSNVASSSSTFEHAKALHERLMVDIQREFQNILVELTNSQNEIATLGQKTVQRFEKKASNRHGPLLTRLTSLKLQAEKNGLNAETCTQGREQLLVELPTLIKTEVEWCTNEMAKESESKIHRAISDAWAVRRSALAWIDNIEAACVDAEVHSICVATQAAEMYRELNLVPAALRADLAHTKAAIEHVNVSVTACKADRDCLLSPLGEAILSDLTSCIADLA